VKLQTNALANNAANAPKPRAATDPILLELWEFKRQINLQANFDVAQLAKQANAFDSKSAMQPLSRVLRVMQEKLYKH
jgi:hypothetical protein